MKLRPPPLPKRGELTYGAQKLNSFVIDLLDAIKTLAAGIGGYTIVSTADVIMSTLYFSAIFRNSDQYFGVAGFVANLIGLILSVAYWAIQTALAVILVNTVRLDGWKGLLNLRMVFLIIFAGGLAAGDSILDTIPVTMMMNNTPPIVIVPEDGSWAWRIVSTMLFSLSLFSDFYLVLFKGTHDKDVEERRLEDTQRMQAIGSPMSGPSVSQVQPSWPQPQHTSLPQAQPSAQPTRTAEDFHPHEVIRVSDQPDRLTPEELEAKRMRDLLRDQTQRFETFRPFSNESDDDDDDDVS